MSRVYREKKVVRTNKRMNARIKTSKWTNKINETQTALEKRSETNICYSPHNIGYKITMKNSNQPTTNAVTKALTVKAAGRPTELVSERGAWLTPIPPIGGIESGPLSPYAELLPDTLCCLQHFLRFRFHRSRYPCYHHYHPNIKYIPNITTTYNNIFDNLPPSALSYCSSSCLYCLLPINDNNKK